MLISKKSNQDFVVGESYKNGSFMTFKTFEDFMSFGHDLKGYTIVVVSTELEIVQKVEMVSDITVKRIMSDEERDGYYAEFCLR